MRYCVSGRQPYSVMKRADEIKVAYNDKDKIFDMIEKVPEAVVILDFIGNEKEWRTWEMYSEKFKEFYVMLHDLNDYQEFNENGIKWYWPYPITSFYELRKVADLGPAYLMLGAPLTFDLETAKRCANGIPFRMIVNIAQPDYLPTAPYGDGVCGSWVRPEDQEVYGKYIQCFEFDEVNLTQEETLLHIYKEVKLWQGNLNLLIKRLNYNIDNRLIEASFGTLRTDCGQRCMSGSACNFCNRAFHTAKTLRAFKDDISQFSVIDNK